MVKKGAIKEIFSKALYVDNPESYKIHYRDYEKVKEKTLSEFIKESDNFQLIPISRIEKIMKDGTILFEKKRKDVI